MKNETQQRSYAISCLRVFSMILIVLCHIIKYYSFIPGSSHMPQIFNVGVQIFFLISGYLQGGKEVVNYGGWMYKKAKRIWIPVIFVVAADVIALTLMHAPPKPLTTVMYLLNFHGLLFLNWSLFGKIITEITNLGPLWFTTIIMLCFCIVPVLQKIKKRHQGKPKSIVKCAALFSVLFAVVLILHSTGVLNLSYIFIFSVGYCFGAFKFNKEHTCVKHELLLGAVMITLQLIRIFLNFKYPSFQYYLTFTVVSHTALGIWLFYTGFFIEKTAPTLVRRIAENRVLKYFDVSSYFIYLVHGIFCMGTAFNVFTIFDNLLLSSLLFIGLTLAASFVLRLISKAAEHLLPERKS